MQNAATHWHTTPVAQALIARLNERNVRRIKHVGIPNDYYSYTGISPVSEPTIIALNEIRAASVDVAFGATFLEAEEVGQAQAYMDTYYTAPEVYDVINEAFAARRELAA